MGDRAAGGLSVAAWIVRGCAVGVLLCLSPACVARGDLSEGDRGDAAPRDGGRSDGAQRDAPPFLLDGPRYDTAADLGSTDGPVFDALPPDAGPHDGAGFDA
jgi:hypothetical protein